MTQDKNEHARANARGWSETINALVAALECDFDRLAELHAQDDKSEDERAEYDSLRVTATIDGDLMEDRESVELRIQESPLSVQVRSGWYDPTNNPGEEMKPEEFEILLSTGGPALRIMGELDEHCQPRRAWLQWQDWGRPWTAFTRSEGAPDMDTLLTFCSQFYFGE